MRKEKNGGNLSGRSRLIFTIPHRAARAEREASASRCCGFLRSAPFTAATMSGISPVTFFSPGRFSTEVTFDHGTIGDISCLRNRHRGIVSANVVVVVDNAVRPEDLPLQKLVEFVLFSVVSYTFRIS